MTLHLVYIYGASSMCNTFTVVVLQQMQRQLPVSEQRRRAPPVTGGESTRHWPRVKNQLWHWLNPRTAALRQLYAMYGMYACYGCIPCMHATLYAMYACYA